MTVESCWKLYKRDKIRTVKESSLQERIQVLMGKLWKRDDSIFQGMGEKVAMTGPWTGLRIFQNFVPFLILFNNSFHWLYRCMNYKPALSSSHSMTCLFAAAWWFILLASPGIPASNCAQHFHHPRYRSRANSLFFAKNAFSSNTRQEIYCTLPHYTKQFLSSHEHTVSPQGSTFISQSVLVKKVLLSFP